LVAGRGEDGADARATAAAATAAATASSAGTVAGSTDGGTTTISTAAVELILHCNVNQCSLARVQNKLKSNFNWHCDPEGQLSQILIGSGELGQGVFPEEKGLEIGEISCNTLPRNRLDTTES
jgi:hypothetical protein